jgi:hypothetical protein
VCRHSKKVGNPWTNELKQNSRRKREIVGIVCYHAVQNRLSSQLLYKNVKIKNIQNYFPCFLYGRETWSLTLREEHRTRVFENGVLRRIFGLTVRLTTRPGLAETVLVLYDVPRSRLVD